MSCVGWTGQGGARDVTVLDDSRAVLDRRPHRYRSVHPRDPQPRLRAGPSDSHAGHTVLECEQSTSKTRRGKGKSVPIVAHLGALTRPTARRRPAAGPTGGRNGAALRVLQWATPGPDRGAAALATGRCRHGGAFAKLSGTSPIEASTGRIARHRLDRDGACPLRRPANTRPGGRQPGRASLTRGLICA